MKRSNAILSMACLSLLYLSPLNLFSDEILPTDLKIRYVGRFDTTNPLAPRMYWSGTHLIAWFEGTSCQVKLASVGEDFLNIIIDNGTPVKYDLASGAQTIDAANGLSEGIHKIEVFKRTSYQNGSTVFLGFITDDGKGLAALRSAPAVKIEFYGDSFTDGRSVDAPTESEVPTFWNNYLTYAAITARNLGMEYVSIASNGIAVLYPREPGFIMDNYYDRIDPGDDSSSNAWDFSKYTPDIVVIYLLGNDNGVNPPPHTTTEQDNIIAAYENLILKIRAEYPNAEIICALDYWFQEPVWPGYVDSAVDRMNTTHEDSKVNSFFFTNEAPDGHPSAAEHELMAEELTEYIQTNLGHVFPNDSLIGGAPILGLPGWFLSDWFGAYNTTNAPWIFHAEHGFIYRDPSSTNQSMFAYDDAMTTWWWTNETDYPYLYAFDPPADNAGTDIESEWLFYFELSSGPRVLGVVTGASAGEALFFGP